MADEVGGNDRIIAGQMIFDVNGMMNQLKELSDEVAKFKQQVTSRPSSNVYFDELGGTIQDAIRKIQTATKQGVMSLAELEQGLLKIQQTYKQLGAFDPQKVGSSQAIANESAITNALVQAEKARTQVYQAEQRTRIALEEQTAAKIESLDKLHYQALQENQRRDVQDYNQSVDQKIQRVKYMYDLQLMSAQDAFDKLNTIYEQDYERFDSDQNKKLQLLKQMYSYEVEAAKQAQSQMDAVQSKSSSSNNSGGFRPMNHTGFGYGPLDMATMMVSFEAMMQLFDNIHTGLITMSQDSARLQTVFDGQIKTQDQLNSATNDFAGIAQEYATSVDEVMKSATLWGRQYSEEVTQVLTANSTLLSVVDNLSVTDANRAVESTIQAYQMQITNAQEAQQASMRLADAWSKTSHTLSVSSQDLTNGFERASASAHLAGLTIDQLNALIASGVNNKLAPCECKLVA